MEVQKQVRKSKKKKILLITIISILFLLVAVAVYFFQFTSEGYRMSVPYRSSFEKISYNVYSNRNYSKDTDTVNKIIESAKDRVRAFWGELQCEDNTIIIICDDDKLISKLGRDKNTVTTFFPSKQNYISVSDEYFNIDILAHEITHSELHTRLSAKALQNIPTWFDEGIALQNDYREQYSETQWIAQTDNGKNIVAVEDMDTPSEFYAGTVEDRRFRYLNAKHEVSEWLNIHHKQGFLTFLDELNSGENFHTVYER